MWRRIVGIVAVGVLGWLAVRCGRPHVAPPAGPSGANVGSGDPVATAAGAAGVAQVEERGRRVAAEGSGAEPAAAPATELAGCVVDERGRPVAGATIEAWQDGYRPSVEIDAAGRFAIERAEEDRASRMRVTCSCDGYDTFEDWLPWGGEDLRIVLRPAPEVAVHVVDEKGLPVPAREVTFTSHGSRAGREHELVLDRGAWRAAVSRGAWILRVEPTSEDLAAATFAAPLPRRIEVGDVATAPIVVVLPRACRREVRVVDQDGARVAGARVAVIDARGASLRLATEVDRHVVYATEDEPLEIEAGTTDATGRVVLAAPIDRPFVVRAAHPRWLPVQQDTVRWTDAGPLVLPLGRGADGEGMLLVEPWCNEALQQGALGVRLARRRDGSRWPEVWPADEAIPVRGDGRFTFAGTPPGRWEVLACGVTGAGSVEDRAGSVELRAGANPDLVVDMRGVFACELHARVLLDGKPWAGHVALARVGSRGSSADPGLAMRAARSPCGSRRAPIGSARSNRWNTGRRVGAANCSLRPGAPSTWSGSTRGACC